MTASFLSIVSFVLISSFTPGPSNISTASMALLHGYKDTLKYQAGLAAGVWVLMLLSGMLSMTLMTVFPAFEVLMGYIGAAYILYLAYGILKASYTFTEKEAKPLGFTHGFLLQIFNPKLVVYAFTLFSAFLTPVTRDLLLLVVISMLLAVTSFGATSVWALFGTGIRTCLNSPRLKTILNLLLSLSLIYTALTLVDIL